MQTTAGQIITLSPHPHHRKYDIATLQPLLKLEYIGDLVLIQSTTNLLIKKGEPFTETANIVISFTNTKNHDWFEENNIEIKLIEVKKNV